MKRFLVVGVVALGVVLATQQQAPAWINFKMGVGLNWHWQSGGNNILWGVFHDGQPPGPDYNGGHPYHNGGHPYPNGGHDNRFFFAQGGAIPTAPQTQATPSPVNPAAGYYPATYSGQNVYQPVSYYPPSNYAYPYYPAYWQGYGYAPYYWGR